MSDVPRSANGWPLIEPEAMTDIQLVKEAYSWRSTALHTHPGTVGGALWDKYTAELVKRGIMTEEDRQVYRSLTDLAWFVDRFVELIPVKRPWWKFWR